MSTGTRGGTFIQFRVGTTGASARHVAYITRERAVLDREEGITLHNLPEPVREARDYDELRANLIAYAGVREDLEVAQHHSRGEPRTHYRVTLSFERDVSSEKALGMVREWLGREFPKARGFAAIHWDTEQIHLHVWIDARQSDGRKIQLSREQHRSLDSSWNRIYSRELGRDSTEHEQKKRQTREARSRGWEQGSQPVLPDRIHRSREELKRNWERREVGVHAAQQRGRDYEGGTFLERVRTAASRDLQEARSWDELHRRLERHGLHVEARGRGMVITDGTQYVKASAVDREASRQKLEQRFGSTLTEHARELREREGASGRTRQILEAANTLDRAGWLRQDQARWAEVRDAARARLHAARWATERAAALDQDFTRALASVFADPDRARRAFDQQVRETGVGRALEALRSRPDSLGELRSTEQRRLLGLVRTSDVQPARERAHQAAEIGRELLEARAAVPREQTRDAAQRQLDYAERRLAQISRSLEALPERRQTLARIAANAQDLTPAEAKVLQRWLSAPQRQVLAKAQGAVERLVPEEIRDLARWAVSPQRQLPASIAKALQGAYKDRELERGIQ